MANTWYLTESEEGWEIERHDGDKQIIKALDEGWEPFAVAGYKEMGHEVMVYFRRFKKKMEVKKF